jgi:AraC family transcriptional regulator
LAKIALELEHALEQRRLNGARGGMRGRVLARGDGWVVEDVICTSGPQDRSFEEQHGGVAIAMVVAGSFQYHASPRPELMTPGSLLLGNVGQCYECGHAHGAGDRCISFRYAPGFFEDVVRDAGLPNASSRFPWSRVPPLRDLSRLVALACTGLVADTELDWEELSLELAAQTLYLVHNREPRRNDAATAALARVTGIVRAIEEQPAKDHTLAKLARQADLSPYHFLRTFEQVTGVTPHQFTLRARLREAALRLALEPDRIIDIIYDCGFGDVSNFNRTFRAEFGVTPRAYRNRLKQSAPHSARPLPRVPTRV